MKIIWRIDSNYQHYERFTSLYNLSWRRGMRHFFVHHINGQRSWPCSGHCIPQSTLQSACLSTLSDLCPVSERSADEIMSREPSWSEIPPNAYGDSPGGESTDHAFPGKRRHLLGLSPMCGYPCAHQFGYEQCLSPLWMLVPLTLASCVQNFQRQRFNSDQTQITLFCIRSKHKLHLLPHLRYSFTGWWFEPLWKIWKSIGMIIPNIWEHRIDGNQTTNHLIIVNRDVLGIGIVGPFAWNQWPWKMILTMDPRQIYGNPCELSCRISRHLQKLQATYPLVSSPCWIGNSTIGRFPWLYVQLPEAICSEIISTPDYT